MWLDWRRGREERGKASFSIFLLALCDNWKLGGERGGESPPLSLSVSPDLDNLVLRTTKLGQFKVNCRKLRKGRRERGKASPPLPSSCQFLFFLVRGSERPQTPYEKQEEEKRERKKEQGDKEKGRAARADRPNPSPSRARQEQSQRVRTEPEKHSRKARHSHRQAKTMNNSDKECFYLT